MAKAKGAKAPPPKGGGKSAKKRSPMLKLFVVTVLLGAAGYAAYTVPVGGRTVWQRTEAAFPWTIEVKRRGPAVTKGSPDAPPAETITPSEREALDQLVRR